MQRGGTPGELPSSMCSRDGGESDGDARWTFVLFLRRKWEECEHVTVCIRLYVTPLCVFEYSANIMSECDGLGDTGGAF